jgi:hypothetical protein
LFFSSLVISAQVWVMVPISFFGTSGHYAGIMRLAGTGGTGAAGVRVMIRRWGLPEGRSQVPLLLSPLVREESFRVLGCSGGLERGRG